MSKTGRTKAVQRTSIALAGWCLVAPASATAAAETPSASIPYVQTFDDIPAQALPAGWVSSRSRYPMADDFSVTPRGANSAPHAVVAENATVEQWLLSPPLELCGRVPTAVRFTLRRSASFASPVLVQLSHDGGNHFPLTAGDTLYPPIGSGRTNGYERYGLEIPQLPTGTAAVLIRWKIIPAASGVSGSLRLDDVSVDAAVDSSSVAIQVGYPPGAVVLNELMYAPAGDEPEWLELHNTLADTADVSGWGVADRGAPSPRRFPARGVVIPPGGFRVFTRDSAALAATHPSVAHAITPVSGFPSLNNTGDDVVITDASGVVMDSVSYIPAWGGEGGKSLERGEARRLSTDGSNWGTSRSGSTPGRINSRSRKKVDLEIDTVRVRTLDEGLISLAVTVCNPGLTPFPQVTVVAARSTVPASDSPSVPVLETVGPDTLSCADLVFDLPEGDAGLHLYVVILRVPDDGDTTNNTVHVEIAVPYARGVVRFNEIMFAPLTGDAEYVELVNTGRESVVIGGWTLVRRPGGGTAERRIRLRGPGFPLPAGGYVIVAGDSNLSTRFPWTAADGGSVPVFVSSSLVLSNEGDDIVLADAGGKVIDSVRYSPDWHSPAVDDPMGRSLEKLRPDLSSPDRRNWGTCVRPAGGTPGLANSIVVSGETPRTVLSIVPNPFSPDGDGYDDRAVIRTVLPGGALSLSVTIFDVRGRLIRRLVEGELAGPGGEYVWDGRDDERRALPVGMYVVYLEAVDQTNGEVTAAKKVVVLARRL